MALSGTPLLSQVSVKIRILRFIIIL
uniref:Uncharacterized protein n=1 Tax=Anguilla anguilla TaxID=7936 RepID=A0A0E9V8G8_ANGAN